MNETTKRQLLITTIVASLLPVFLLVEFPGLVTAKTLSLWFGALLGYAGLVLLLWMYILGAKSVMGLVFTDLAPVLSIHKWIGKYGVVLIFIHPVLMSLGHGESFLYQFMPDVSTYFERHVTLGRIALWVLLIIWVSSAILRDRIAFRPWKYLHYLAYLTVPFALLHVPDLGSQYLSSAAVKIYFFTLVLVFVMIMILRLRGFLNLDKLKYAVIGHTKLSDTDYVLNLKPVSKAHLNPKRGQYIYIKLGHISEDHPFSVLQYDEKNKTLVVGYRVSGRYTNIMSRLKVKDTVYVGGPYGSFMADYETDDRPAVFLAGGIGITPFVDQIIQNNSKREQWLFAANRSRTTAVLVPEIAPYLGKRLVNVYSREASPLQKSEVPGRITPTLLKKHLGNDLTKYSFYLCGPPAMMDTLKQLLIQANVSKQSIYSEKFGW